MPEAGFDPPRFDQTTALEAAKQRVDRAFGNDQIEALSHAAQHFEAVEGSRPKTGERGQFHAPFTQLHFPLVVRAGNGGIGAHAITVR
jgi:hypothetical protein